jgi:hypothetical protein
MERRGRFMAREVFDTILHRYVLPFKDRNRFCPPTVILHKDGESTLHRDYDDFIRAISDADPGLKIDIYTHGLTLPRKSGFLEFLGALPCRLRMLMSFHFYNGDGSANDYAATDALVRKYLDEGRWPRNVELILTSHVVRPMTIERLAEWKATWQRYVDGGQVSAVHANAALNPWTGRISEPGTVQFNGCPYGDFGHFFFGVTGNVIACCLDLEEEIVLGNVLDGTPPEEMFARAEAFYAEQRRILAAQELHPRGVCRNCFGQKRDEVPADLLQLGVPA